MSKCKEGHTISPLYGYCVECYEDWRTEMFEEQKREEERKEAETKAREETEEKKAEKIWETEWDKEIDKLNNEFKKKHKGKEDTITTEYYKKWMRARIQETYRKTKEIMHNKEIYNQKVEYYKQMEIDIRGGPQLRGLPLQELLFDITVALYYNNIKEANKFFKINPEWIKELIHRRHIQDE